MKIINTTASLLAILIIVISAGFAHAAGSSVTIYKYSLSVDENTLVIQLACIADDTNGTVPVTTITKANLGFDYINKGYYLWEVWTRAKSPAPDAADVEITDALGSILYTEVGIIQASGTPEGTIDKAKAVTSNLTVTQSNQATVDAEWSIYIKLVR